MENYKNEDIKRISHNIESLSADVYKIRKSFEKKEKIQKKLSVKEKRRRESLRKAQKKFKNISTNLKIEIYEKLEKRIAELNISKSAYVAKLILDDLNNSTVLKRSDLIPRSDF